MTLVLYLAGLPVMQVRGKVCETLQNRDLRIIIIIIDVLG